MRGVKILAGLWATAMVCLMVARFAESVGCDATEAAADTGPVASSPARERAEQWVGGVFPGWGAAAIYCAEGKFSVPYAVCSVRVVDRLYVLHCYDTGCEPVPALYVEAE